MAGRRRNLGGEQTSLERDANDAPADKPRDKRSTHRVRDITGTNNPEIDYAEVTDTGGLL